MPLQSRASNRGLGSAHSLSSTSTDSLSSEDDDQSRYIPEPVSSTFHSPAHTTKVKIIRDTIRAEDKRLRNKYAFFREEWQDAVGLSFFLASILSWAYVSVLWYHRAISTFWLIILNALSISILHEMEHDLIHDLFFKRQKILQNIMFAGIWLLKSNANPWWRRYYHLRHHQFAGQAVDVEERMIGLGLPWYSWKRIFVTLTPAGTLVVAPDVARDDPEFSQVNLVLMNAPVIAVSTLSMLFHLFLPSYGHLLPPHLQTLAATMLPWVKCYNCMVNFPNFLRQTSLVIISTYSHYFGDIPPKDVYFQTQILDHPILAPFQAFCFNFGATHIMHHFVTRQPFYLRQAAAFKVIPIMKRLGVRTNDLGSHFRANRWGNEAGSKVD